MSPASSVLFCWLRSWQNSLILAINESFFITCVKLLPAGCVNRFWERALFEELQELPRESNTHRHTHTCTYIHIHIHTNVGLLSTTQIMPSGLSHSTKTKRKTYITHFRNKHLFWKTLSQCYIHTAQNLRDSVIGSSPSPRFISQILQIS